MLNCISLKFDVGASHVNKGGENWPRPLWNSSTSYELPEVTATPRSLQQPPICNHVNKIKIQQKTP